MFVCGERSFFTAIWVVPQKFQLLSHSDMGAKAFFILFSLFLVPCRRKYPQRKDDHYVKTIYF